MKFYFVIENTLTGERFQNFAKSGSNFDLLLDIIHSNDHLKVVSISVVPKSNDIVFIEREIILYGV